jgi:hypothetical protein
VDLSDVKWSVRKDGHRWKYSWSEGDEPPTEGHAFTRSGVFDALWHSIQDAAKAERREQVAADERENEYGGSYDELVRLKQELAPEP